ncbi:molybdenum cofactor guanylyltransferase [Alteromonas sp. 14N.309.X.WAT.G.H12]|uniref:molybdenum cofactor guanylyltransferase n=1 Tax=Alteromonas sp. 14N.309.X.WAT.G.H12 TaxID=3120824 RepID=UPI002FD2E5E7
MGDFNGLILAGGKSSRMGQDKAKLLWGEETLLARGQRILKEIGAKQVFVSRNDGHPQHIADVFVDKGPLSGIHAACDRKITGPLLVLPVDLPLVTHEALKTLVCAGLNKQTTCCYKDHNLPLFIYDPASLLKPLQDTLSRGCSYSVGRFFSRFPMLFLPLKSVHTLTNTNTPDQWQAIVKRNTLENML